MNCSLISFVFCSDCWLCDWLVAVHQWALCVLFTRWSPRSSWWWHCCTRSSSSARTWPHRSCTRHSAVEWFAVDSLRQPTSTTRALCGTGLSSSFCLFDQHPQRFLPSELRSPECVLFFLCRTNRGPLPDPLTSILLLLPGIHSYTVIPARVIRLRSPPPLVSGGRNGSSAALQSAAPAVAPRGGGDNIVGCVLLSDLLSHRSRLVLVSAWPYGSGGQSCLGCAQYWTCQKNLLLHRQKW